MNKSPTTDRTSKSFFKLIFLIKHCNCKKVLIFAVEIGLVAQLNRASDYGSEGFRFES
jgi:hypothetical protein